MYLCCALFCALWCFCRGKKAKTARDREHAKKTAVKIESIIKEESHPDDTKENEQPSLPVVDTWEFELEDDEYLNFLELFLSYVLEKDSAERQSSSQQPSLDDLDVTPEKEGTSLS